MASASCELMFTPRNSRGSDGRSLDLSALNVESSFTSPKIPDVFKGRTVPWTPRGMQAQGLPKLKGLTVGAPDLEAPPGVLSEMIAVPSNSPARTLRKVSTDSPAGGENRTESSSSASWSAHAPGGEPDLLMQQWTNVTTPSPPLCSDTLTLSAVTSSTTVLSDYREQDDVSFGTDVSFHEPGVDCAHQACNVSPMCIKGLVLNGRQGIPEDVRKNLGALVRFMRENVLQVEIQAQCCVFLCNYASFSPGSAAKAARAGALSAVLVAMKRYSENGANNIILNELACWCLSTLCRLKESAVLVAHAGGIKQMLNMMCVFKDSPSVQEQGCWFLKVMSAQSTVFCLKVKSCNAEAVISSTLHRHAQVPRVVAYAQMCLVVLEAAGPATPQDYTPPGSPIKIPGMGDTSKNKKWNFLGRK